MSSNEMTDLQLEAQKAILDDERTREHEIEILECDGIITLKGKVPSHEVSLVAKPILEETLGISNLIDELHLEIEELDDEIKEKVSRE